MTDLHETVVIRKPVEHAPHRVRLLLSGGGNRAMMGSAGAITYLTQTGWWDAIDEVVSVSGGSTTNAALMTGGTETTEATIESLRSFYERATTDIGQPWKEPKRVGSLAVMASPIIAVLLLLLMALGLIPGPSLLDTPIIGLGVGLVAPTLCSVTVRRGAGAYLRNYLGAMTAGSSQNLTEFGRQKRQHVICASGLSTAQPYYLWGGGSTFTAGGDLSQAPIPHESESLWGAPLQGDHSVADAVFASSSLPTLAQVKTDFEAPAQQAQSNPQGNRSELLIDGGVSGIFGGQISAGMKKQSEQRSSPDSGHIIVIDSGRHVRPPSRAGQLVHRLSIGGLLARWLKVSLEANYQRDLLELDDAHLIRIAEGQAEHPPEADGVRVRLDKLRTRTAEMGLANFNAERALNAYVTGWVGASLSLNPNSSTGLVFEGLQVAGQHMGKGNAFADYWQSLG